MFSSNANKFFFLSAAAAVFLFLSCGAKSDAPAAEATFAAEDIKSGIPFSTKEPENFQAEFVVAANDRETKTFVAQSGGNRRYDYNFGAKNQWTILQTEANRIFLILPDKKIYSENAAASVAAQQTSDAFKDLPIGEWLNQKADARFTKIGAENGLTRYRVVFDGGTRAESIIFIDEKIGLPVRQEFYGGEPKSLTFVFEMRNFRVETDSDLFEIPKDFRSVSPENLKTEMKKENFGEQ